MGKASRAKRARRGHPEPEGGGHLADIGPVDVELKPLPILPSDASDSYQVVELTPEVLGQVKVSLQPAEGEPGTYGVLRRIRATGQTLVAVQRGAAGVPTGLWWVAPCCGNTWEADADGIAWKRSVDGSLKLSLGSPLHCDEDNVTWRLSEGTLKREEEVK